MSKNNPIFHTRYSYRLFALPGRIVVTLIVGVPLLFFGRVSYLLFSSDSVFAGLLLMFVVIVIDLLTISACFGAGISILKNGTVVITGLRFWKQRDAEPNSITVGWQGIRAASCVILPENIVSMRLMSLDEKKELIRSSVHPVALSWNEYQKARSLKGSLRLFGRAVKYLPDALNFRKVNPWDVEQFFPYLFLQTSDLSQDIVAVQARDIRYVFNHLEFFRMPEVVFYIAVKDSFGLLSNIQKH